ncbi:TatD family hydrolase [Ferruginibacter paludis]|uniref:TatD family hydrolase n=1 Tax=Ferruginibacter paludis TaxID=1310417 RepID=UPI0025B4DB21|nr:TatD family hydrolase [Ferruginibacter paludis]MDN3658942.1 TatD family hydrolase [Ferruginibacter paludis]
MKLIDTHCHLYAKEFVGDIERIIDVAISAGVEKFYLPAIDSNSIDAMFSLEEKYPGRCIAMIGLHPCYVRENYKAELEIVQQWLGKRKFAAVGEIGLDFYWDKSFVTEQYEAFRIQMDWAIHHNLPIVIHTRNAMQETINLVKEYVPKGIRGIFHCFSGSYESAREIIKAGFYLGIGGVVTYKNAGVAEVLEKIDLAHLVLETDAPYLTPVPFRGKRNESSYLKYIVSKIAAIKNCTEEEVAVVTTANAEKIFGL